MAGFRRIANTLWRRYRRRPEVIHLLLVMDQDFSRGRLGSGYFYSRRHPVSKRVAARLREEFLAELEAFEALPGGPRNTARRRNGPRKPQPDRQLPLVAGLPAPQKDRVRDRVRTQESVEIPAACAIDGPSAGPNAVRLFRDRDKKKKSDAFASIPEGGRPTPPEGLRPEERAPRCPCGSPASMSPQGQLRCLRCRAPVGMPPEGQERWAQA